MTYEQQVREAHSPQEALLVIARALDCLVPSAPADWGEWRASVARTSEQRARTPDHEPGLVDDGSTRVQITGDVEHTDVVIPAASPEKQARRREFEQTHLHLAEHLGGDNDWDDAYAKGGPLWLYLGNRDLVMSYPGATKQAMIMDVEEDSPKDAHEMGRDLLKADCETGPGGMGMRMAEGEIG